MFRTRYFRARICTSSAQHILLSASDMNIRIAGIYPISIEVTTTVGSIFLSMTWNIRGLLDASVYNTQPAEI